MDIGKIGEFGLINRIKKHIRADATVVKGIGDDCAVIRSGPGKLQLYTCDMIVEGVDFTARDSRELAGRKALAVCVSDIAACGGVPRYALVSLGLPSRTQVKEVDNIYKGLNSVAREFGINIVGGDISKAPKLAIDVSLIGETRPEDLILRSGAKKGDIIFVTGSFGGSLRGKHLNFTPRLKESRYLTGHFKINSMIDVSDGLAQDLGHILEASKAGAVIYEDLVPQSPFSGGIKSALCDGEDFELVFTLSLKESRRLRKTGRPFTAIGEIVPGKYGLTMVDSNIRRKKIKFRGFNHF